MVSVQFKSDAIEVSQLKKINIVKKKCCPKKESLLLQVRRVIADSPHDVSVLKRLNQLRAEFDPILSDNGSEEFLEMDTDRMSYIASINNVPFFCDS